MTVHQFITKQKQKTTHSLVPLVNCLPACVSYFICSEKSNIATGAFCRFLIRVLFAFRDFLPDKRRLLSAHKRNLFSLSESSNLAKFGFHRTARKHVLARFKANNILLYRHTQLLVKLPLVSVDKQNWSLNPVIDLHQLWYEQSNLQHPKGGSIALLTPHCNPHNESIRRTRTPGGHCMMKCSEDTLRDLMSPPNSAF